MLGITLILVGSALALTASPAESHWPPDGLSGLAYIVQGWVLDSERFSATNTFAILGGYVLILARIIRLVVVAGRTKDSLRAPTR
jgi:uncharacterized membrane protein HdeD (DUF308 family)